MSNAVLVIGKSGTGKSASMRNLPKEKTFVINVAKKPLPFKGWKGDFTPFNKENPKGNYLATDNTAEIIKVLNYIGENRSDIEYVVIDDYQYTMAYEYMRRIDETGFKKFNDIGQKAWQLIEKANNLRENLNVAILTHEEETVDSNGVKSLKAKTIGKMVDNVITLEGMFTNVLYTSVSKKEDEVLYEFITNAYHTAKSPEGMFDEREPNDLKVIFEKIDKYNLG
jgi:septin family protein